MTTIKDFMLWDAIADDNLTRAQQCIADGADINSSDIFGLTALHKATMRNSEKMTEMLLSIDGIDIFRADKDGDTALDFTILFDRPEIRDQIQATVEQRAKRSALLRRRCAYPKASR